MLVMLAHHFLVWVWVPWQDCALAGTLGQVSLLLNVIPKPILDATRGLLRVAYYQ
jgi:hypothetical protein